MAKAGVYFADGPCKGRTRRINYSGKPPPLLVCDGTSYTFYTARGINADGSQGPPFWYVVAGGQLDRSVEQIRGERDVLRAWSNVHNTLNKTVPFYMRRVANARRRIRGAVR